MPDADGIGSWLVARIAGILGVEARSIRTDVEFLTLGLSSLQAVELSDDLQRHTGSALPPTLLYDCPTIDAVAALLTGRTGAADTPDSPDRAAAPRPVTAEGPEPIAIVGIGCRVPGAAGPQDFWRLLCDGTDAVGDVPSGRWDSAALYDPDPAAPDRMNTRWGGFLDDVEGFDAAFFGIAAREAARMDPQQRLALEVAWEALEDAAVPPATLSGSGAGVFMGVSTFDHAVALFGRLDGAEAHDGTGGVLSIVANRLSYCLNLRGPSLVVDTACSSSLVAVHLACQALQRGETDLAIAGGVNVIASPRVALSFSRGGLMAADGRCKPFDHRADGYVRSEGAGVVVLRTLSGALAAGDRIYAVVRGGAVNSDGRTNGLTAPSEQSQAALLRAACGAAAVDPAQIDYVEAHGTGTAVGDRIEAGALAQVLAAGRGGDRPLLVGSVKSNLGHLEAAAGVAGLIKVALALHHGEIPPTVHFERLNPRLGLDTLALRVVAGDRASWPDQPLGEQARLAGVSSFGFGGTNAHLVLSGAPAGRRDAADGSPIGAGGAVLVPVSARSASALRRRAAAWAETLRQPADDHAWVRRAAAAARRTGHDRHRAAVVAANRDELAAGMVALAAGRPAGEVAGPREAGRTRPRVVFVFPGQGPQWAGMCQQLAASVPVFRAAIHRCDAAVARWTGRSMWNDDAGLVAEGTAAVQPALFAMQVALAETWRAWGVEPAAVIGHSMGEIAAACVSGALSLDDAARIACARSRLLDEISGSGGLVLVELGVGEATALVRGREHELSVAAVNGPRATVLSGRVAALDDLIARLSGQGVFARRIDVAFAAHGPQVEPVQARLRAALDALRPGKATTPLYSTVTGGPVPGIDLGAAYWERNVRAPVLFAPTLQRLLTEGYDTFVEIAPHPVLARPIGETAADAGRPVTVVSSMRRSRAEAAGLLSALGELYTAGVPLRWEALYPGVVAHADVPRHGWEHQSFPLARLAPGGPRPSARTSAGAGALGRPIRVGVDPSLRLWSLEVDLGAAPEIADHLVDGTAVVPGAYWLTAAAAAAAAEGRPGSAVELVDVTFTQPCPASRDAANEPQLALHPGEAGSATFTVTSWPPGQPALTHAQGVLRGEAGAPPPAMPAPEQAAQGLDPLRVDEFYARLAAAGLRYGPRMRSLDRLWSGAGQALGRARPLAVSPQWAGGGPGDAAAALHPALLDGCLQVVAAADTGVVREGSVPVPVRVGRVWSAVRPVVGDELWCHARITGTSTREVRCDITISGPDCRVLWAATGFTLRMAGPSRPVNQGRLYRVRWEPRQVTPQAGGGWLVVAGSSPLGRDVSRRLRAVGERCLVAVEGPAREPGERTLVADAGPRAYQELLAEAENLLGTVRGIVDARIAPAGGDPLAVPGGDDPGPVRFEPAQVANGTIAALRLAQAHLGRTWSAGAPRLWLTVASGAEASLRDAGRQGLGLVLANEHPSPGCGVVELASDLPDADIEAFCALLRCADPPSQAAVRDGEVLVPVLATVVDGSAADGSTAGGSAGGGSRAGAGRRPIRHDRAYVVTGGLGVLGLRVARWLVGRGARHLVLVGRGGPSAAAQRALDALRDEGVDVRVAAVDVADPARLRDALRPDPQVPPVGGVFHLAGVLEDALVADLSEPAVLRALAGKAVGAWNLHRLTVDEPVEHFVLFSSLAGLIGSPGQAAYASGNVFLDALARYRAAAGLPAVSVDWGTWSGAGLAVEAGGVARLAARGVLPLEPATGLELLAEALDSGQAWLAAAAFDPGELRLAGAGPAARQLYRGLLPAGDPGEPSGRDLVLAAQPDERRQVMRRVLTGEVARVLGAEASAVAAHVPLQELGFDSLMAIELRDRLEAGMGVRLSATMVYAHPTVIELADAVLARLEQPRAAPPQLAIRVADPADPADPAGADDLSRLSDEEIAEQLERELEAFDLNGDG